MIIEKRTINGKLVRTFIHRSSNFLGSWISNITVHFFQCQLQINQSLTLIQSMALKGLSRYILKVPTLKGCSISTSSIFRDLGELNQCDIS